MSRQATADSSGTDVPWLARSIFCTGKAPRNWVGPICGMILALAMTCQGWTNDLPWTVLRPEHDSRDPEMRAWDEADSRSLVDLMNRSEEAVGGSIAWRTTSVLQLLEANTPFAELRFDAVRSVALSDNEKLVLAEWLRRGGFLLLFEDTYPYPETVFRHGRPLAVYDFVVRDLPESDPRFKVARIDDTHVFFRALHETLTTSSVAREMAQNPHYRGRRLLTFEGRAAAFVMGRYSHESEGVWVPMQRPFSRNFGVDPRSYHLILNIYFSACLL